MGSLRDLGSLIFETFSGDLDIAVRGPTAACPCLSRGRGISSDVEANDSAGSAMPAALILNKPQRHIQCDHVAFVSRLILQQTSAD
jgi:hypothetical protein